MCHWRSPVWELGVRGITLCLCVLFAGSSARAGYPVLDLTPEQERWVQNTQMIRIHVHHHPPYVILNSNSAPQGIAIDLLNSVVQRLGLQVEYVKGRWPEAVGRFDSELGVDVLPVVGVTAERNREMLLTDPYSSFPSMIFTRKDYPFVSQLEDLTGRLIAVERASLSLRQLQTHYPDMQLVLTSTAEEALERVATGRADAYVGDLAVGQYLMRRSGFESLRMVAPSGLGSVDLAFAVRRDQLMLAVLMQLGVAAVTAEEKAASRKNWLRAPEATVIDWQSWIRLISVGAVMLLFMSTGFLFWRWRVKRQLRHALLYMDDLQMLAARYRDYMRLARDPMLILQGGVIVDANAAAAETLRVASVEGLLQREFTTFLHPGYRGRYGGWVSSVGTRPVEPGEARLVREDHSEFMADFRMCLGEEGGQPALRLSLKNTENQREMEDELRRLATLDTLTNVPNRTSFMEILRREIRRAHRQEHQLSLLTYDLDLLREINDRYSHAIGDQVLERLVAVAKSNLRVQDQIGRIGGGEFAIILHDVGLDITTKRAEDLRRSIEQVSFGAGEASFHGTVSIGVTAIMAIAEPAEGVLKRAEAALDHAKGQGRNQVAVHDGSTIQGMTVGNLSAIEMLDLTNIQQVRFKE